MIGLQNAAVMSRIYEFYQATGKKRNEQLAKKIDETLKENEIGVLMMRENHQVQFPSDIQVFYISPPALDEIKRFVRDQENKARTEKPAE
jgi:tRNA splicing ligase